MNKFSRSTLKLSGGGVLNKILAFFIVAILSIGISATLAYFTASASSEGTAKFAIVSLSLTNDDTNLTSATYAKDYLSNVEPGDTIDFTDILVENTGEVDLYVLANLYLNLTSSDITYTFSLWYNLDGDIVNSADLSSNTAEPTVLSSLTNQPLNLNYYLSGMDLGNSFKYSESSSTLTIYGLQCAHIDAADAVKLLVDMDNGADSATLTLDLTTYSVPAGITINQAIDISGYDDYADKIWFEDSAYTDRVLDIDCLYFSKTLYAGYTKLEYIESSGNQYIDTGVYVSPNTRVVMDAQFTSSTTQQRLFGTGYNPDSGTEGDLVFDAYINGSGCWAYAYQNAKGQWRSTGITADTDRHTWDLDGYNKIYSVDGVSNKSMTLTSYTATNTSMLTLSLLARHQNAATGTNNIHRAWLKLYSTKIYDSNVLMRDFIPVLSADGEYGLFDYVTNTFYGNGGTGSLTGA